MTIQTVKRAGLQFNLFYEKYLFLIIPASLMLGFLFSSGLLKMVHLVPLLFAYLTFVMALGCSFPQIRAVLNRPLPFIVTFLLTHLLAPVLAYWIGSAAFGGGSPYVVGMVLFAVIPLGVSSVIWVSLSGGSVPLILSMIVLDSALSPIVVPVMVRLFFGTHIDFDVWSAARDMFLIIVLPTILGVVVNELSNGGVKRWSAPVAAPTSKLAFSMVVMINAAVIAPQVMQLKSDMALVIPLVIVLVACCYGIGYIASLLLGDSAIKVTLTYASGMRNISLGIVLAIAYFEPKAAVPVVMAILIQQPMATLFHAFTKRLQKNAGVRAD